MATGGRNSTLSLWYPDCLLTRPARTRQLMWCSVTMFVALHIPSDDISGKTTEICAYLCFLVVSGSIFSDIFLFLNVFVLMFYDLLYDKQKK